MPPADADDARTFFPVDDMGSAYLVAAEVPFFIVDKPRVGGGAINAASGSLHAAGADGVGATGVLGTMGGGAKGLATSAGSSPGKIQHLSFSS